MKQNRFLNAAEAARALGISKATLYCYVSRGMIRSEPVAGQPRVRIYANEDVARLLERKDLRRNPSKAAERGLHWGSPVLESALSLIRDGRLYYRGVDAVELAQRASVEEVAALLWTGDRVHVRNLFGKLQASSGIDLTGLFEKGQNLGPVERCQLVLPRAASQDAGAHDLRPMAVARTGVRILRLLASAICGAPATRTVDAELANAWSCRAAAIPSLRAALILSADHELNVSAFTARCVASSRATPYQVVMGALAAFRGRRHGGATQAAGDLFHEARGKRDLRALLAKWLQTYDAIPGFGHPLYPDGDPRAAVLLSLARANAKGNALARADRLIEAVQEMTGDHPNLDFGLAVLACSFDLPKESAVAMFALGRTIGWIAHAIEQYANQELIRPRARYIGPLPQNAAESTRANA
jgi:citrate synthase